MINQAQCKHFDASGTIRCELETLEDETHHQPRLHTGTNIDEAVVQWGGQHWHIPDEGEPEAMLTTFTKVGYQPTEMETWMRIQCDSDEEHLVPRSFDFADVLYEVHKDGEQEFYVEQWQCRQRVKVSVDNKGRLTEVTEK